MLAWNANYMTERIFFHFLHSFPKLCHFLLHSAVLKNGIKCCLPVHDHWWHPHVTLCHDFVDPLKSHHFCFHYRIRNRIKICKTKTAAVNHTAEHYKLLNGSDLFTFSSCVNL